MTNCRRGDLVLALFPDSNLRTSKRRPALVGQADNLGTNMGQTIIAMITSNMARSGHPSNVEVPVKSPNSKGTGLLVDSVIMVADYNKRLLQPKPLRFSAYSTASTGTLNSLIPPLPL